MERHRFLALLLEGLGPVIPSARVVLDIAPNRQTGRILARTQPAVYVRLDLEPAADARDVNVQASMTAMPLPDTSVDLAICYHVLEHIPDDHAAMTELRRVLAPGAAAFVQVPWRPDQVTDEDPGASEPDRVRRFGQHDHVRYYGRDFEDRLRKAGLEFTRVTPRQVVGVRLCKFFALLPDECHWIVRRDDVNPRDVGPKSMQLRTLPVIYDLLASTESELLQLRSSRLVRISRRVKAATRRVG